MKNGMNTARKFQPTVSCDILTECAFEARHHEVEALQARSEMELLHSWASGVCSHVALAERLGLALQEKALRILDPTPRSATLDGRTC